MKKLTVVCNKAKDCSCMNCEHHEPHEAMDCLLCGKPERFGECTEEGTCYMTEEKNVKCVELECNVKMDKLKLEYNDNGNFRIVAEIIEEDLLTHYIEGIWTDYNDIACLEVDGKMYMAISSCGLSGGDLIPETIYEVKKYEQ